MNSILILRI